MKSYIQLLACVCITRFSYGQDKTKDEQAIVALENEYVSYFKKGDYKAIADYCSRVLTDDFLGVTKMGNTLNKNNAIEGFKKLAAASSKPETETYKQQDMKVRIYGNGAVVTGLLLIRSPEEAKASTPPREERFTHYYEKINGTWKLAGVQWTIIQKEPQQVNKPN